MLYVLGCFNVGEFHSSTVAPERLFGRRIANRFDPENRRKNDNSRTTRPPFVYEYGYFPYFLLVITRVSSRDLHESDRLFGNNPTCSSSNCL